LRGLLPASLCSVLSRSTSPPSVHGVAHGRALDVGSGERIEHVALGVGPQQRLGLMLAVEIDQQRAQLRQHAHRGRTAVHQARERPSG